MATKLIELGPIQQAEQALQMDGVLARMQVRFEDGSWARGLRFGVDGGNCLIGAIDEATRWAMPGVAEELAVRLAEQLPRPFRAIARLRPRLALALYNDTIGGQRGALELVRATRANLFAGGPVTVPTPSTPARRPAIWVS